MQLLLTYTCRSKICCTSLYPSVDSTLIQQKLFISLLTICFNEYLPDICLCLSFFLFACATENRCWIILIRFVSKLFTNHSLCLGALIRNILLIVRYQSTRTPYSHSNQGNVWPLFYIGRTVMLLPQAYFWPQIIIIINLKVNISFFCSDVFLIKIRFYNLYLY